MTNKIDSVKFLAIVLGTYQMYIQELIQIYEDKIEVRIELGRI